MLASFDDIVVNVSDSTRLQEECDILALRISKHKGPVNFPEYKAVSLKEASAPRVVFDAVAPQVLWLLSVLRGANARAAEAFALRETPLWTHRLSRILNLDQNWARQSCAGKYKVVKK